MATIEMEGIAAEVNIEAIEAGIRISFDYDHPRCSAVLSVVVAREDAREIAEALIAAVEGREDAS